MNFYIDTRKSALQNPVLSVTNTTMDDSGLSFVSGDKIPIVIQFTNNGTLDTSLATTGSNSSSYFMAIGDKGATTPYTSTTNFFISHSWGITGSLDLSTGGITGSFAGADDIAATLQFSVYTPSGSNNRTTYMLRNISLYNAVDN